MDFTHIKNTVVKLKPTYTSMGYALFIAVNATVIWGGVFPFLPMSFQTREITISFFLMQSLAFMLYFVLSMFSARFPRNVILGRILQSNAFPYALGWVALIAATYVNSHALLLTLLGGALIGFNTAGFFMQWNIIFAVGKERASSLELLRGMVYAPLVYFALYLIPIAMTVYLVPIVFMPLFLLSIRQASKGHEQEIQNFEHFESEKARLSSYQQVLRDYWRSAVCIGSIGFASGVMRSIAVTTPASGGFVNMASMVGVFVSALVLFALWANKPAKINAEGLFRMSFPALMILFGLLPVFGEGSLHIFAAITYVIYGCGTIIMMMQCEKAARVRHVKVAFIYGFVGAVVYALHDFGFITGQFAAQLVPEGANIPIASAFVMVFVLAFAMYVAHDTPVAFERAGSATSEHAELVATAATPEHRKRATSGDREGRAATVQDKLSKQVALAASYYELSDREAEVLNLYIRGYSAKRVSEELLVSENTVNTHIRRMYKKLNIHKKQKLIEMVETFNPKTFSGTEE